VADMIDSRNLVRSVPWFGFYGLVVDARDGICIFLCAHYVVWQKKCYICVNMGLLENLLSVTLIE